MTAFFKEWLLGIVASALTVAIAQSLIPDGTVKKIGRLAGGMLLLLAAIRPLLKTDLLGGEPGVFREIDTVEQSVAVQAEENREFFESLLIQEAERIVQPESGEEE